MIYTQTCIKNYLEANPLGIEVSVGDVKNLNGGDYIFLNYTNDDLIGYDNRGTYRHFIQITVATRNFDDRRVLVNYIKRFLNVSVNYEKAIDFEYFVARCECGVLMYEED